MTTIWPAARTREIPFIVGNRVLICAFSPVTPLLAGAGLVLDDQWAFRRVCVGACLEAAPARPDQRVGALVRDLDGIASRAMVALNRSPDGEKIKDWLLFSDGGLGGGDPRGFWRDAIRWAGRRHPPFATETLQRAIWGFCDEVRDAMLDPAWTAAVDDALAALPDEMDLQVTARQGFHLLTGAAVGGDINQIGMILGPVRDWAIMSDCWSRAPSETRAALEKLAAVYWSDRRARGWDVGSRIDDAWIAAPENRISRVMDDV